MDKFVLNQLFENHKEYSAEEDLYYHPSSSRVNFYNYSLFLRIFREVRKKLKRGNQFDVALEIKKIFKTAQESRVFGYISSAEFKYNFETYENEYTPLTASELEEKNKLQKYHLHDFLKQIGLTEHTLSYLYYKYDLNNLANYYNFATPAAIVQMRKRIKQLTTHK